MKHLWNPFHGHVQSIFHGHFPSTLGPSGPIRTSLRFCMAFSRRPSSAAAKSCWETRCRSASRSFPALSKRCRRPSSQDRALERICSSNHNNELGDTYGYMIYFIIIILFTVIIIIVIIIIITIIIIIIIVIVIIIIFIIIIIIIYIMLDAD
jgi:Flp pilus assembly protein TadB